MRLMARERIAALRVRGRSPAYASCRSSLRQEVGAFLPLNLDPPDQQAGFYHDYFCPQHGVELHFDPARPHAHRCPQGGEVFSGEPYDAAWRWSLNNRLSTMAFKLALLWQMDQDEACRVRVEEILLGYARRYGAYEPGEDPRPVARGRATFQSLDEAVWLLSLVRAYDLVRSSLAAAAREQVETELLRPAAGHIAAQKYRSIHNIECWHNAAIGAVGICLDEPELVQLAVEAEFGFRHQLEAGVRADGLWWEGSSSYHFYALTALLSHAQVAEVADPSLRRAARLRQMFQTPVDLAAPDLRLPATNDCWFFTSLVGDVCHGVPAAAALYEVAYGWYGVPEFARVLERNYRQQAPTSVEALLYGRQRPLESGEFRAEGGTSLEPSGLALLRAGAWETQNYLLLKYGPHGGSHGHPDKLGISFYAGGYAVSPDLGTPGYGMELHETWYRQTLSHNTVVVDGRSQPEAEGRLQAFGRSEDGDFAFADARVEWREEPYQGVSMRRLILWTNAYFIDYFQVECEAERQLDWTCRFDAAVQMQQGLSQGAAVSLEGDGYEHVAAPLLAAASGAVRLQWGLPAGHLDLFLPCERDTLLIQGQVPCNPAAEKSDLIMRRRQARSTVFVALLHPWTEAPVVEEVFPVEGVPTGVLALWVHTRAQRHLWVLSNREHRGAFALPESADRVMRYTL